MTIGQIAAELDSRENTISKVLRQMQGRAVHVDHYKATCKGRPAAFWLIGPDGEAPMPECVRVFRSCVRPVVRSEMVAFLKMVDLLFSHPVSMADLQEASGSSRSTCLSAIRLARAARIVRICMWDRQAKVGDYTRYFEIAVDRNDVPKPKKLRQSEYAARYARARRSIARQQLINNALAANSNRMPA
jgi:hypothetical protein